MQRSILSAAIGAILACTASAALAQDYPNRPVKWLQGFAPGGNADAISRVLADELGKRLGQPVVVEARPGAGGNLASEAVAKASPDGYTIVLITTGHVISAALYKSLNFDPINDFEFITTVSELPFFLVVNAAKSSYKTMVELVDAAKNKPAGVTYGTAGVGTGQHLSTELLNSSVRGKLTHVPYRGDSAAVAGLLSGDIDFVVAPLPAILGNLQAGTFRALGQTGLRPWFALPDVPPIASVVPGYESIGWTGVATTRGVQKPIVERLNKELRQIIALPHVDRKLRDFGGAPASSTPAEISDKVKTSIARFNRVIDDAKIERR